MKKLLIFFLLFSQICAAQIVRSKVTSFTLINAVTDQPIRTLTNGSVINLAVDGNKLNIRANTSPTTVNKVSFVLTGAQTRSSTDNKKPYSLFGDVNGNYNQWTPRVGNYTLKATPTLRRRVGTPLTISFTVIPNTPGTDPAPTVTVNQASSQSDPTSRSPILFTATFSEPVTGFTSADVVLSGTARGATKVVTGGPRVYTISVSGMRASGTVSAAVPAGAANDSGGNPNTASTSSDNTVTYTVLPPDDLAPTVTVNQASSQLDPTSTSPIFFTATFSETVTGFTSTDVILGGTAGAASVILTGGPTIYKISVSGMTASGTVIATVPAGAANDAGGNSNTASTSFDNTVTYTIPPTDLAPSVTVNQASGQSDPASGSPILFTATFSEAVTGFTSNDVVLSGTAGAASKVVTGGPTVYNISVSGMTVSGTVTAGVPAGAANDAGGNSNTASTSFDNTVTYNLIVPPPDLAPTVTINQASGQSDPTSASPILFTATFSEAVTGFASGDVIISGTAGAASKVVTGGPTIYTISVSGMTVSGTVTAGVPAGAANDAGGNSNTASTSADNTVTYNLTAPPPDPAPTVTINQASGQSDPTSGSPILFTATFSEAVTGFASADVIISGTAGATSKVVTGGPSVYTISVSGMTASGTVTAAVPAGAANDAGGNPNTASTSSDNTVTYSTTVTPPAAGEYYASPAGTGNGSLSNPFKISDFWPIARPGYTLYLMDGIYTGASSMINPPENLSGMAGKPITIKALNDGKVDIDGQRQNAPIALEYNNYFTLEGFNAHHAGSPTTYSVSVVSINYSSYNILRRICAWEATDGNTNVFGIHHGDYNLLEDCAGWGTARKTFSNSQQGNYTTFRRCFGRWEGSHAEGPKKTFGVSYNSYNALLENCIGTWDGLKMQQNYELHDYYGVGVGQFFTNYQVQQPDGIYSHDGFDVLPDVANARIYGCIAYIKGNQRYHNSTKKWAAPFAFEIKGVDIKNSLSYIQPGSYTDIWNVNLGSVGNTTTNSVKYLTQIGGELGHISSDWTPQNMVASTTCNGTNTGTVITKRFVDGVLTNQNLWPWPMNQRIIDAMTQGAYTPVDVTREVFGLCGNTPPSVDIVAVAKQWLASPTGRDTLEAILDSWVGNIDSVIKKVKPVPSSTQTGQVFYQSFTNPVFRQKYPNHQYHMYVPTQYNASAPIGVMLWLHGGGSWDPTEIDHLAIFDMDNEQVTGRSYPRTLTDNSNYILVAPIAPFGSVIPHPEHASRWNVPNADQYLMDIITELSVRYNIDYNRVVVAGFSMGGIGAYHQALRLNDRLAAVMASAGSWTLGTWDGLKNMPMYLIQGVNDAHYNSSGCRAHFTPIEYARLAHNSLYQSSTIHRLYEYPGEHPWDASGELYWKNFINGQQGWVTDKVRNPYRSNVTAVNPWRSYDAGSNFNVNWTENPSPHTMWVSIKQTGTGTIPYNYARTEGTGGCSSLADFNNWSLHADTKNMPGGKAEANITGQNQITVTSANVTKMSLWLHPDMVNFKSPVSVTLNGITKSYNLRASLLTALKSYERRWDWGMIYHTEIDIY